MTSILKRMFLSGLVCVLVTGCFFDKPKKDEHNIDGKMLVGDFIMEDIKGEEDRAYVLSYYAEMEGRQRAARALGLRRLSATAGRATECTVSQTKRHARDIEAPKLVSVGELSYRHEYESTLIPILESEDHVYSREISPHFMLGYHYLQAKGTGQIAGFAGRYTVPEELDGAQVNGTPMAEGRVSIRLNDPLELQWDPPAYAAENNIMAVFIDIESQFVEARLECEVAETELTLKEGLVNWQIPSSYLVQLPASGKAQIALVRGHVIRGQGEGLDIMFQTLRTVLAETDVERTDLPFPLDD